MPVFFSKKTKKQKNWMIIQILISVLKGKAGSPGERGPAGKLVSIVYLVDIFLLNFSCRALIILF